MVAAPTALAGPCREASMDLLTRKNPKPKRAPRRVPDRPALWRAFWRKPSDQRRNGLVEDYQPLVLEVVYRFAQRLPRSVDRGDLETAGNFGLMRAISSFDPTRKVRFEIYAEMRIRGAILDELRARDWLPRLCRTRLDQQKRMVEKLRSELGREPTDPEIAGAMELPFEEYELLFGTPLPGAPAGNMPLLENGEESTSRLDVV